MSEDGLTQRFHDAMIDLYYQTGRACGYWAHRYLQFVRRHGGVGLSQEREGSLHRRPSSGTLVLCPQVLPAAAKQPR